MKITVILSDDLIDEVKHYSKGKNITESMFIALKDRVAIQEIKELNHKIIKGPLKFKKGFSADKIRLINRQKAK